MATPPAEPPWFTLFRMGTAAILFVSFVSLWPDYGRLFGNEGLVDGQLLHLQQQTPLPPAAVHPGAWWVPPGYLLCCTLLALGVVRRGAAMALLLLQYLIFNSTHGAFSYGFDYIASSCLFYCLLFPVERRWAAGIPWSLRFLQAHLCIIYFFAGLGKALGAPWRDGEALWKAVVQPGFESVFKPDLHALGAYPWLWVAGGWAVIILEVGYPFVIWVRPVRRCVLLAMVSLHVGIALCMGLYFFSALMVLLNLAAFHLPYRVPAKQLASISDHPIRRPADGGETPATANPADATQA